MKNFRTVKLGLSLFVFGFISIFLKTQSYSQCTDIFISEYVEGNYNNKALEIYNPTPNTISLSNYQIKRYSNGASTASTKYTITLSGSIGPYKTKVYVVDRRNPSGTGQDTIVFDGLRAKADTFVCPDYNTNSALSHNGNDAITIEKISPPGIVDIFGEIGKDPGTAWDNTPPYDDGLGKWITEDYTLIRKSSVKNGVTVNPSGFNALGEYDTLPKNTFDSLGTHRCACKVSGINEDFQDINITLFPNPVKDNHFVVRSTEPIRNVKLMNVFGQEILTVPCEKNSESISVNIISLPKGLYFLRTNLKDGRGVLSKVMIQ